MNNELNGECVLVVGTTTDYIDIIRSRFPGRSLFLTEQSLRLKAPEETPEPVEEVLADLDDTREAAEALESHLSDHNLKLSGIVCFDDESLVLASHLAQRCKLHFHSEKAVWTSRSKFHTKRVWMRTQVPCPRVQTVQNAETLEAVIDRLGFPLVLKPLTGSGSELVFWCRSRGEARTAFQVMTRRLADHPDVRLYPNKGLYWPQFDPSQDVIAEEGFTGPEYSCDFLLKGNRIRIIRLAGKIINPNLGAGTAYIYYIPIKDELGIPRKLLENQLILAARSLGFDAGLFMADFISHRGKACFLEISPRLAGDCLPWLVFAAGGVDILGLALDVAEDKQVKLLDPDRFQPLAAVRVFSKEQGVLERIDSGRLSGHPAVVEAVFYRSPGHRIILPPEDYASRILGHIIFRPVDRITIFEEGSELEKLVGLEIVK